MKEKLFLPQNLKGDLWLYNKERFLDLSFQSFVHRHDELELNMVTRGWGTYLLNNRKVELVPNSILWLFPEQEHLLLKKSLDFEMWILVVKPDYLRAICTDRDSLILLEGNPGGDFCRSLTSTAFQKIAGICKDTLLLKKDLALFNISMGYIMLSAWAAYLKASTTGLEKNILPVVDKVTRLIVDGAGKDDLTFLAREVGLSATSLSRLFKRQMGISLTAFRNRCRVEQFLDLYGDGQGRTMLDACLDAGFGSYAQFYRVFKQTMGGNPSDYRRTRSSQVSLQRD